ncbi:hypothetical protein ACF1CG_16265 [Streptomyces sp. NPDC014773]|uniref:hypothetical protein n=1 Tax=Streptomyces sp. NPDC014773 TaxID=3364908 RepID=UPI0036FF493A
MPAWVVVIPSVVLAVVVPAVLGTLYAVATGGPRYLETADVVGVWTEKGGDGRLTLRQDNTAELTGTVLNGGPDEPPLRGTWRVGIPDEPRTVELDLPFSVGMDVDESGGRATLSGAVAAYGTTTYTEYLREPG